MNYKLKRRQIKQSVSEELSLSISLFTCSGYRWDQTQFWFVYLSPRRSFLATKLYNIYCWLEYQPIPQTLRVSVHRPICGCIELALMSDRGPVSRKVELNPLRAHGLQPKQLYAEKVAWVLLPQKGPVGTQQPPGMVWTPLGGTYKGLFEGLFYGHHTFSTWEFHQTLEIRHSSNHAVKITLNISCATFLCPNL